MIFSLICVAVMLFGVCFMFTAVLFHFWESTNGNAIILPMLLLVFIFAGGYFIAQQLGMVYAVTYIVVSIAFWTAINIMLLLRKRKQEKQQD
jgi:O-antigen/teichoic acid export membrane protein